MYVKKYIIINLLQIISTSLLLYYLNPVITNDSTEIEV